MESSYALSRGFFSKRMGTCRAEVAKDAGNFIPGTKDAARVLNNAHL